MDPLQEYQHRRLELADTLRAEVHVARAYQDEAMEQRARQLLARLAQDQFTLAVVGQFSRGKSTLMNAILGADYLPTGALPMTSVVTTVRYGSRPRATFLRRGRDMAIEIPIAEIPRVVAQSSTQRSELQVTSVDIEIPAEILRLGFAFVDTPGVGSSIGVNTATTKRFLPQADAVIFVTSFDSALTAAECDFLADASQHTGKVFCVVNKRDVVSDQDAAGVLQFIHHTLLDELHLGAVPVFALSALDALRGRTRPDDAAVASSGLPAFESALVEFLTTEKTAVFLRNLTGATVDLIAIQRRNLQLGLLTVDGSDLEKVTAAFETKMGELNIRLRSVASDMEEHIRAELPDRLAVRSDDWRDDLHRSLAPQADEVLSVRTGKEVGQDTRQALRDGLEQAGSEVVLEWLFRRAAEVNELLIGLLSDEIGTLLGLAASPDVLGVGLEGLTQADGIEDTVGWSAEDVPVLVIPVVDWEVPIVAPHLPHLRATARDAELRKNVAASLDSAIAATDARARERFVQLAEEWVQRMAAEAERRVREAAILFDHYLRAMPSDQEIGVLEVMAGRLAGMQEATESWIMQPAVEWAERAREVEPNVRRAGSCAVCVRLEEILSDYLRQSQFGLATLEGAQTLHAHVGGYCALHTWQYYAMASPLGISAGYAKLAQSLADALDTSSAESTSMAELADQLGSLVQHPDRCPVCAALIESEGVAVASVASSALGGGGLPTLCMHHLARVLAAGPTPDAGRAMVHVLAETLRRNSEDMRTYALKREAFHRGLITGEESAAHLGTLKLLAGQPGLVRPWFVDEISWSTVPVGEDAS